MFLVRHAQQPECPGAQYLVVEDVAVVDVLVGPVAACRHVDQVPTIVFQRIQDAHGGPHGHCVVIRVDRTAARRQRDAHEVPGGTIDARRERSEAHLCRLPVTRLEIRCHLSLGALRVAQAFERAHEARRDRRVAEQQACHAGHDAIAREDRAIVRGARLRGVDAMRSAECAEQGRGGVEMGDGHGSLGRIKRDSRAAHLTACLHAILWPALAGSSAPQLFAGTRTVVAR